MWGLLGGVLEFVKTLGSALLGGWIGYRASRMSADRAKDLQHQRFDRDDIASLLQAEVTLLDATRIAEGNVASGFFPQVTWKRRFDRLLALDRDGALARAFSTPRRYRNFLIELSRIERILWQLIIDLDEDKIKAELMDDVSRDDHWTRRHRDKWIEDRIQEIVDEWSGEDTVSLVGAYLIPALRRAQLIIRRELTDRGLGDMAGPPPQSSLVTLPSADEIMMFGYGVYDLLGESERP